MSSAAPCPALCCCRRPLHPGPVQESPHRFVPGPPDPASASSFQLYRLHHFHLGLELRPDTRDLSGCLVLEVSPLVPGGPALVLDTHPVVKVSSVRCRRGGRHGSANQSCPHSDPACPKTHEDATGVCQAEGISDSSGSSQTTDLLWSVAQEPGTAEPSPVLTPEPLDLSVSGNVNHHSFLSRFPAVDLSCSSANPAAAAASSAAGPGGPIVNGHPPTASPLNPLAAPYSPTPDLSFHSSCYTLSPNSLLSPTLESSFAPAVAPPHFPSMDIPRTGDLPSTFIQPCGIHNASDSGPAHCTCCFPLDFRVDEFTDYGSALTITVPETLQTNETFQVIVHYVTGEGPAVSPNCT